jgi:hypothetical protein
MRYGGLEWKKKKTERKRRKEEAESRGKSFPQCLLILFF